MTRLRSGKRSSSNIWASRLPSHRRASFIDDLGADSLDIVELVMAFEEESGRIPDDAAKRSPPSATRSNISTATRADVLGPVPDFVRQRTGLHGHPSK